MPIPAGSGSGPAPDGLSYDPILSRVRLSARVPSSTLGVVVDRSTDGVRWAAVRGADLLVPPPGGLVSVSDYEFAAGVVNQYRVRAYTSGGVELGPTLNGNPYFEADNPILNSNPYFETDAAGWSVNAGEGSIARSTAQAHEGVASLLLTPDGVGTQAAARGVAATGISPGQVLRGSAWMRCAVARSVTLRIDWRNSSGTFLSSSTVAISVAANTWTYFELVATAPASTAQAGITALMTGTPPASNTLHIDEATIGAATPAGWVASGGTIARSTAQAHEGAASLLLTPDGVSASAEARTDLMPATAGRTYRASAWVRCAVSRSLGVAVNWYQAGGTFISQSASPTVSVAANTWTLVELSATAPALTGQARLVVGMVGTPPTSHLEYIDEACLVEVGGRIFTGPITPQLGTVWLKSVARPFLNRPVSVRDFSDVSRPNRGGVFEVVGRSFPVAVTDVRGSRRWTLQLATDTPDEANDLDLLLAGGDILLVHVPQNAGRISAVPGGYVTVGDTRIVTPPTYDLRMRVLELPLVEVAAPGPDVVGATVTCQSVLNTYVTCQAVLDAHPTCVSLMELIGDPTDVIVA